jgi:hypothetical protein
VRRGLLISIYPAQGKLDLARRNIDMQRVSGWYKRSSQIVMFCIAVIVVSLLNINTITIAQSLYLDKTLAKTVVKSAQYTSQALSYKGAKTKLYGLNLPTDWQSAKPSQSVPQALTPHRRHHHRRRSIYRSGRGASGLNSFLGVNCKYFGVSCGPSAWL